jgi:hypothetical protein
MAKKKKNGSARVGQRGSQRQHITYYQQCCAETFDDLDTVHFQVIKASSALSAVSFEQLLDAWQANINAAQGFEQRFLRLLDMNGELVMDVNFAPAIQNHNAYYPATLIGQLFLIGQKVGDLPISHFSSTSGSPTVMDVLQSELTEAWQIIPLTGRRILHPTDRTSLWDGVAAIINDRYRFPIRFKVQPAFYKRGFVSLTQEGGGTADLRLHHWLCLAVGKGDTSATDLHITSSHRLTWNFTVEPIDRNGRGILGEVV